jgi:hypothetical protein
MHKDFLQPEITEKGLHWQVDTRDGLWFVPGSVAQVPDWIKPEVVIDGDATDSFVALLQDFVGPDSALWVGITVVRGYCGRLSAPGYLDATDWTFGRTLAEVRASVKGY